MANSLVISLTLHVAFLLGFFLLWPEPPSLAEPARTLVKARQVKVEEKPKTPKLQAGASKSEPIPQPVVQPELERKPPATAPTKPVAPPSKKPRSSKKSGPQLLLPEPDYPTAPRTERSMQADAPAPEGPDVINLVGTEDSPNSPAVPYYHPTVTVVGTSSRDWILVEFQIERNGVFRVQMLEGTGDIHRDARALNTLRRWKWIPRKINGERVASVEVIRLYKREETR